MFPTDHLATVRSMNIEIKWDDAALKRVLREVEAKAMQLGRREIERRLQTVRCPLHGTAPKTTWQGDEAHLVDPCCDQLGQAVTTAVG
jgi:hypothetical protein